MTEETIETIDISKPFAPLQKLIGREGSNRSQLWQAWNFLLIYSNWGLRLPNKASEFELIMGGSPAEFDFFEPMLDGNKKIISACDGFQRNVFSEVVQVGMDLKVYAQNTAGGEDGLLQIILDLIEENDTDSALELLVGLQEDATRAEGRATIVKNSLAGFRADLSKASGKLDLAHDALEKDSQTNEKTLGVLAGNAKTKGSLKYYHAQLEEARRLHTEAAVAAGTSPLYIWVLPPIGLIATGIVMGVYTDKAIKRMKDIERLEDTIKKKGALQEKAVAARNIYTQGNAGLTNVISYTDAASAKCGIVQDAWKEISSNISEMAKWLKQTTSESVDGQIDVKAKTLLGVALRKVEKNWQKMLPELTELTTDNYVTIQPGTATISEAIKHMSE